MLKQGFRSIIGFFRCNRRRLIILALLSILLYGTLFLVAYVANPGKAFRDFGGGPGWTVNTLHSILGGVATYYILIYHVMLPLMRGGNRRRALGIACVLYTVKLGIGYWFFSVIHGEPQYGMTKPSTTAIPDDGVHWFLLWDVAFYLADLFISFSAALAVEWIYKSKQQAILEKQKAEAELSALKHQINPHFLFNSLSFIYSKIIKIDEETADSVMLLSDIMRYALGKKEDANGRVNIMVEVEHMKNVIEINQRRHNHRLHIIYGEHISNPSVTITPLVLITLVENAFKHGDPHDKDQPILIDLHTNEQELSFYIKNKKSKGIKELSNGIGLENIRQQLELVYGGKYALQLEDGATTFEVLLKIPLNP